MKPYDSGKLEAHIRALLRRYRNEPYEPADGSLLHLHCRPGSQIHIQCTGNINIYDMSTSPLHLDIERYAKHADGIPRDVNDWRFQAKTIGEQLFQSLISVHSKVNKVYYLAIGAEYTKRNLHIKILSNREFIRVPVESLFGDEEYLCLQHPLVRTVEGVNIRKQPLSQSFFNSLHSGNEPFKVLLIAANTCPPIPGVDKEIAALEKLIFASFSSKGLRVKTTVIASNEATYEKICNELHNCSYHVVHYSGHGRYEATSAEKSGLRLWEDDFQKNTKPLSAIQMRALVENSDIRFFYLSCCLGTTTANERQLLDDDFLGIADALIQAGIPSVLGFRWPVSDRGAVRLAVRFYDTLARDGRLDISLLEARKSIERDDLTWLSPVLIAQK